MRFSNRIEAISESGSVAMAAKITALRKSGKDIISLAIGEPDFVPHEHILEATSKAVLAGETRYSQVEGLPKLREMIAKRVSLENNLSVEASNVLLSNGSKQSLYNIFQALCNPGDEVLVPSPYWVTIPEAVRLAGGVPVFIEPQNLRITASDIKPLITTRTRALVLNSPNNPSGLVINQKQLEEISKLVIEHDLILISDEAYSNFCYDSPFISPASLGPEMFERTLTVQTFSKTYGMTGYRLGYVVASHSWIQNLNKLQSHLTGNNCTFAQFGAMAALELPMDVATGYREEFKKRRDLAYELGRKIFDAPKPEGAFYLFPNVTSFIESGRFSDDQSMAMSILNDTGVALLPGSFFGAPNYLRISFAASTHDIERGFKALSQYL